ncbi:TCR/Tet family MFS transporter [Parerythrobacter jejuensis]|uniref:MFS transporter n=1 Tax=Parerythrobacter jejuensis TaxID=795812 RepID=A0A845AWN7_9SPHN|nr:TCR/Tet family MFS transporter [Parerythrobacter jejuensis]MXP31199.1 MFS transporter [Parerythrobacter jejuensis]MXP33959.1 MFS transporter [Parerythrobacter jejuensis]
MQRKASVAFIFILVLLDMIGFGIVMPVLPQLIMELGTFSVDEAAIWAGWLGAGYAAMQFIFAPILGNLSDRFGRRPVLLACVFAFSLDYFLMGLAPSIWWLVLGRFIAGLTGASFAAAYAYIADITEPEDRAASFGLLGMAFGFGFIIGPALGGFLGEIGPRIPFYAAGAFALANFVFGFFFLDESLPKERRRPFRLARANALSALRALSGQDRTVLWFLAALGVWQLSHLVYPAIWAYFAIAAYGWSEWQIGLSLMMVGIGSALVQGFGLRLLLPILGETRAVILGIAAVCVVSITYTFARSDWIIYAALLLGGLQGLVMPSINSLNSRAVDASSQGELQGATQAIGSLAAIVGPPMYTIVFAAFMSDGAWIILPGMPLLLSAVLALGTLAIFLYARLRLSHHEEKL